MSHQTPAQPDIASARVSAVPATAPLWQDLLRSLRPKQWLKNGLLCLAALFSVNQYWFPSEPGALISILSRSFAAFGLWCMLSSAEYLLNDFMDAAQDREHPTKRFRPIAAGRISKAVVLGVTGVLLGGGLIGSFALSTAFGLVALGYVALTTSYTLGLKHQVIIDVCILSMGFVLRAVGGAVAIDVPISPWLYVCTFLGALFLAIPKRRHELLLLDEKAGTHRRALEEYSPILLDQMINVVAPSTVIAYSLYTFSAETLPKNHAMMWTIPFVLYGVFRYLYLVYQKSLGGSPEETLLSDAPLIIDIVLWLTVAAGVLLFFRGQ